MIRIGVAQGSGSQQILASIEQICLSPAQQNKIHEISIIDDNVNDRLKTNAPDNDNNSSKYNIIILNEYDTAMDTGFYMDLLDENAVLILNSDEKNYPPFQCQKPVRILTYGFNPKSSITASSVIESEYKTVQCCIQRAIPTFTGSVLEPQEFSVSVADSSGNIYSILSAVAATLLCGANPEKIGANVFI